MCGAPAVLMRMDLARQQELIRRAHGRGDGSVEKKARRTVYRSFRGSAEAGALVDDIRRQQRPLAPDFLRRYFGDGPTSAMSQAARTTTSGKESHAVPGMLLQVRRSVRRWARVTGLTGRKLWRRPGSRIRESRAGAAPAARRFEASTMRLIFSGGVPTTEPPPR